MIWLFVPIAAATPTLETVCVAGDVRYVLAGDAWTRIPNTTGSALDPTPPEVAIARSSPGGPAPDAPTWTETLQIRRANGVQDVSVRCHQRVDGVHRRPEDVSAWFEDEPGSGVQRCRSRDGRIGYRTTRYVGGPVPYPGTRVGQTTLVVDGHVVAESFRFAGHSGTDGVELTVTMKDTRPVKTSDPRLKRSLSEATFTRADGRPLLEKQPTIQATLTCERYAHPPMP